MKKLLCKILLTLILTLPASLSAYDFGLVINADGGFGNAVTEDAAFDFKTAVFPRFSTPLGENGELVVSAGFSIGKEEDFFYIPELLRTEYNMVFGNSSLKIGRVSYADPFSFIADGLFDGVQYGYNSGVGSFRAGAWYTGLQYKGRANIAMTEADITGLAEPVDYADFSNTYFSSKRAFASAGWEHPSIADLMRLNAAVIAQFDLNAAAVKYDSQYAVLKASVPVGNLLIEAGGSVEFSQAAFEDENKSNTAFAGELGLFLLFPSKFNGRLSFTGLITGGINGGSAAAFVPITGKEYGYVLKTRLPGLSIFSLNYSSKFKNDLSGSFTALYFLRNDLETFIDYPVSVDGEGKLLGLEASARVIWNAASDLQLSVGGGAFFPSLGNAGQNEKVKWRVDLGVIMSVL